MKFQKDLFKGLFFFFFSLLFISYTFFDDGGISTKNWNDLLVIPLISAGFALIFSLFFSIVIIGAKRIVYWFSKLVQS